MTFEIEEVNSSIACVTLTFGADSIDFYTKFKLNRYHPNCNFKLSCALSNKINEKGYRHTMKVCLEQENCLATKDKPISVLLCVVPGDSNPMKWSQNTERDSHVWNSEEIVLKKVSIDQDSEMYHNFTGEYLHQVTCKFWILISPRQLTMLEDMAKLLLNQNDCDVYFHFDNGKKIGAHINILKLRSPIFASMFQHEMEEKKTGRVHIQDIDSDIFPTITVFLVLRLDQHAFDVRNGKSTLRCSRQIRG